MIRIDPYDSVWPALFAAEAASIRDAMVAADYEALKRRLASENDGVTLESRERYSLSKTEFVTAVLERALSEGYPLHLHDDA